MDIEEYYIDQYKQLHVQQKGYGASSTILASSIQLVLDTHSFHTVVDYGCGKSDLLDLLNVETKYRYDPAIPDFDSFPPMDLPGCLVICTDVMEHVPEQIVQMTLKKIRSISPHALFVIALTPAIAHLPNGENAHCTVKPEFWWRSELEKIFVDVSENVSFTRTGVVVLKTGK